MTIRHLTLLQSLHPTRIYLLQQGFFLYAYNEGAVLLHTHLNYKLRPCPYGDTAGFPITSLDKVLTRLIKSNSNSLVSIQEDLTHIVIKIDPL